MRDRLERLSPVTKHAERQEEAAAEALAQANRALASAEQTLNDLRDYRASYYERCRDSSAWRGAQLQDFQQFLSRLDQAIAAQADVITDLQQRRGQILSVWQDKRRRCQSLGQLAERLLAEARTRQDAAQQKIDDAMALARAAYPDGR